MAKEARQIGSGLVPPAGMNDNQPLAQDPSYFFLHGLHSVSQLYFQRMGGKELINYFTNIDDEASPILNIHGANDRVWIETVDTLYMFEHITDPIPT